MTTRESHRAGVREARRPTPLSGQVAVVTGAGRGIGRAIALRFAAAGADVVCAARTAAEIEQTARAVREDGGRALDVITDVRDEDAVEALMGRTVDEFGSLDIAVLNAGATAPHQRIDRVSPEQWRASVDVNLTGVFLGLRAAVPHLQAAGGGKVIVMGSAASRRAPAGLGPYAAAKAAVSALVRVAARDLRADGIAVNELQPGPTATLSHGIRESDAVTFTERGIVLEEGLEEDRSLDGEWFKSPRSVADVALFLAQLPNHGPSGQIFSLNAAV